MIVRQRSDVGTAELIVDVHRDALQHVELLLDLLIEFERLLHHRLQTERLGVFGVLHDPIPAVVHGLKYPLLRQAVTGGHAIVLMADHRDKGDLGLVDALVAQDRVAGGKAGGERELTGALDAALPYALDGVDLAEFTAKEVLRP